MIAVTTQGFASQRTSPQVAALTATAVFSPKRNECHTRGRNYRAPDQACQYFVDDPTWATFGDSHTIELGYALARRLEPYGEGIHHYSFSNCGPRYQRPGPSNANDNCARWSNEAVAYIAGQDAITTVVVTYRIHAYLFGDHVRDYPDLPDAGNASQREATWQYYRETIAAFRAAGKRVVLVLQAPELPAPVSYMVRRDVGASGAIEGVSRAWWDARRAFVMARLDDLAPGIIIIDPTELICDELVCRASEGDTFLYFDQNHLSVAGMDRVALAILAAAPAEAVPPRNSGISRFNSASLSRTGELSCGFFNHHRTGRITRAE